MINDDIQVYVSDKNDCLKLYENYVDNKIIYIAFREVNRYAIQYIAKHTSTTKPRLHVYK
jgi:hypothetical protein